MKEDIKVSIITVCLNAEATIEKTIKSVILQNYSNIEYIIIDGKSSDGTIEIINKYCERISVFISEKDDGIYYAMNKGVSIATGDFIYFLGADDVLCPDIINKLLPYLKKNKNAIHYGQVILMPSFKKYDGKFSKWKLLHKNISHQAILYPKKAFSNFRYDCRYKIAADWNLNWQLISKGFIFLYNGITIAEFNLNGVSSRVDETFRKESVKLIKNYFGILELLYYMLLLRFPLYLLEVTYGNILRIKRKLALS